MAGRIENQTGFLRKMQEIYAPETPTGNQVMFQARKSLWEGMTPEQYQAARSVAQQELGKLYREANKRVAGEKPGESAVESSSGVEK